MEMKKFVEYMLVGSMVFGGMNLSAQKTKKERTNKEQMIEDTIAGKSFSWSLPNYSDVVGGMVTAGVAYSLQMKYMKDFFTYSGNYSSRPVAYQFFWDKFHYIPATILGLWAYFELRQITTSGLYGRAVKNLNRLNEFKILEMSFESVEHLMQYLAYHGSAKELRIINDEYQHVMTHIFLTSILQELTYTLRLLERATGWESDAVMSANIEKMMFEIRAKIRHGRHNKAILENHPQYHFEHNRYQQNRHLLQEERLTTVAEEQNTLLHVKFIVKTIGRIFSFFFGSTKKVVTDL